jgi:predicted transposase YbfD/YdcC
MQVVSVLSQFPDHRGGQGKKYRLSSILTLVLLGFLSGKDSLAGVARFAKSLTKPQLKRLGIRHGRAPCHATLCIAFHGINVEALEQLFAELMLDGKQVGLKHLAVDGKHCKGSKTPDVPKGAHVLHAFALELHALKGQVEVPTSTNEAKAMLDLIERLEIDDETLITADAMFCHKDIVEKIRKKKGHYLITVKDNQSALKSRMEKSFKAEDIAPVDGNVEKNHHIESAQLRGNRAES